MCLESKVSVFFFQAEDGIRDKLVTGVQTCALPIWISSDKPGFSVLWYLPSRSTTHSCPCGTMRTPRLIVISTRMNSAIEMMMYPIFLISLMCEKQILYFYAYHYQLSETGATLSICPNTSTILALSPARMGSSLI